MTTETAIAPNKHYHQGEAYRVFVIRKGWRYWTGTRWDMGEYNARCYGFFKDAQAVIEKRALGGEDDYGSDPVQIVQCRLVIGEPVTTPD